MARVSSKIPSTQIVEYSTILIIEIGFTEDILTKKNKKIREIKIYQHPSLSSGNLSPLIKETKKEISVGEPLAKFRFFLSVSVTDTTLTK